jgi:hypothetical protein
MREPPVILDSTRVLFFAETGGAPAYTGKLTIFTGRKKLRELAPVPRVVISEELASGDFYLMHCSSSWKVLAVTSAKSIAAAKELGERAYRGLAAKWNAYRELTPEEASEVEEERRVLRELSKEYPLEGNDPHAV